MVYMCIHAHIYKYTPTYRLLIIMYVHVSRIDDVHEQNYILTTHCGTKLSRKGLKLDKK